MVAEKRHDAPRYWRYRDVERETQLSRRTIERAVVRGSLPVIRLGKLVRFRPSDVTAWLESTAAK